MQFTNILYSLAVVTLCTSCLDFSPENTDTMENNTSYSAENTPNSNRSDKLAMKTVMDKKSNMPMFRLPLPESWSLVTDHPSTWIKGPDGIQVDNLRNQTFMATNDPYMQQIYAQSGAQLRQKLALDKVFAQDFIPQLNQNGFKLTKQFALNELAGKDREYMNKLYQSAPSQKEFHAMAFELNGPDNISLLFVMHQFSSFADGLMIWGYYGEVMQAQTTMMENAKNTLLNALHNKEHNPAQIAAYNQNEQQKANASWSSHNSRMSQNQANFEAQQRAFTSSSNAVNNSIMENWRNQNASSDRMQNKYVNEGIWDQTTKVDPNTGQKYYVDNDSKNYWINSNGEYIKSDDVNYNPNTDPNYNNQNWNEMDPTDDGWN